VVVLGIAFTLDVPVLDGANDVALIRAAQLNLDLVASAGVGVLQKQIESPRTRLNSFFLFHTLMIVGQFRYLAGLVKVSFDPWSWIVR
jgi:hypothetical protein